MIEPQEKRKAPRISPRAQQSVPKKRQEKIMRKVNTNTKRMEAPVERIPEAEPVECKSIEEMVKQISLTMDEGIEDHKAKEKKIDLRIAAVEDARATATASTATEAAAAAVTNGSNRGSNNIIGFDIGSGRGSSNDSHCIGRCSIGKCSIGRGIIGGGSRYGKIATISATTSDRA